MGESHGDLECSGGHPSLPEWCGGERPIRSELGRNTSKINDNAQEVWIGRNVADAPGTFLNALVDEVKIYNGVAVPTAAPAPPNPPTTTSRIAFHSNRDGNCEIYIMNPNGTGQTNITNNAACDRFPAWSPGGTKVAFVSDRGGAYALYVASADGTGVINVSGSLQPSYPSGGADFAWSPDGNYLVFRDVPSGTVYRVKSDGTGLASLGSGANPVWSPDGTRIAFIALGNGWDLWVMNADGTNRTQLTNLADNEGTILWSPDSSMIAFYAKPDGPEEVWTIKATGGTPTRLTTFPTHTGPVGWSPDGSRILFQNGTTLYDMAVDGSGQRQLATAVSDVRVRSYSPDGQKVVFASNRDGNNEIYIMNKDGTQQTRLTINSADDSGAVWGP